MIKNIQKYLLLHYPIIWNIRLIPMLLILIAIHIIFFAIGYVATDTVFDSSNYYYSPADDLGLIYFGSILVGILLFIGWLIFYSRNNSFKNFYPRKSPYLFLEWILILVITTSITLIPATLTRGSIYKWNSAASLSEATKVMDLLDKVKILIPDDKDNYRYDSDNNKPIPIPSGMALRIDTLDLDLYAFDYNRDGNIVIKGYTGPSILFYHNYDYNYYDTNYYTNYEYSADELKEKKEAKERVKKIEEIKQWFRDGNKEAILALMTDYLKLQEKHNMPATLTANEWLKKIYNPPYFAVNENTIIASSSSDAYYYDYDHDTSRQQTYLQYQELSSGYDKIIRSYNDNDVIRIITLVCICISTILSVFIFSFRAATGKSWLIAFVACGVLLFLSAFIGVVLSEIADYRRGEIYGLFLCSFWIILFFILMSIIIAKIKNTGNKGKSNIFVNLFMWLLPFICPLIYFGHYFFLDVVESEYYYNINDNEVLECVFWVNILITIVIMFPISMLIRKWKSIPEE
ncbi:hypothetical protein [Dysgonomonas sp. ZJ709]|uniref:hypothetical protein n=1 Tax=Dysgonomonas sp. ZJ709 TaxID=2709797 RepID=UPI0013ECCB84|nr:hypothetical protein [Dysgonomonas sp. ZJ709]